jgi:hypothetical protein
MAGADEADDLPPSIGQKLEQFGSASGDNGKEVRRFTLVAAIARWQPLTGGTDG